MNQVYRTNYVKIGFIIILAALLLLSGKALAQLFMPSTEPGGEVLEMAPSYISGDPTYQNITPPDDNPTTGVNSAAANFSYYQIAGATLRGRSSTAAYNYSGSGCLQTTSGNGSERILNTEAILPDNAVIKYLRVYYIDTNPGSGVEGFITRYQPGNAYKDLIYTGSTNVFSGGYGFTVSQEITETVNNADYAYTLVGWPDENNIANQICGLRVAYYAPFHGTVFIPVVSR
jgi:hypothetical protein